MELIEFVATAVNLDEIEQVGGKFTYPDGLTTIEWECLRGLKRGRNKADKLKQKRDAKKR